MCNYSKKITTMKDYLVFYHEQFKENLLLTEGIQKVKGMKIKKINNNNGK